MKSDRQGLGRNPDKEIARMSKMLSKIKDREILAQGFGEKVAIELMKKFPNSTSEWSRCIAAMCMKLDRDVDCRKLLIEWFHEHYGGFVVEKMLGDIHNVRDHLVSLKYNRNDPIEHGDCNSWFETDNVFIMEDQNVRYAVIIKEDPWYLLHVRKLWYKWDDQSKRKCFGYKTLAQMRKNGWNVEYGDFRDYGYVISYGGLMSKYGGDNKVDGAAHYWSDIEHFIFRISTLHTVIRKTSTDRYSKIHQARSKKLPKSKKKSGKI